MAMTRKSEKRPLEFSLDVITDGSEHTGHGTIFLTISKKPFSDSSSVLARYAIGGLSSTTARLCTDQKFSVRHVRAVTCPTHSCGAGLASLVLNLSQAGAASLAVCGGPGVASFAEKVVSIILRNRAYPKVATCEVPLVEGEQQQWWNIFSDEYVIVHGAVVIGSRGYIGGDGIDLKRDDSSIVLLYTILNDDSEEKPSCSFCVMPPGYSSSTSVLRPLPLGMDEQKQPPLDFVICLDPSQEPLCDMSSLRTLSRRVFCTLPRNSTDWDDGILIRASFQARRLHRAMPLYFPATDPEIDLDAMSKSNAILPLPLRNDLDKSKLGMHPLESCTSLVLESTTTDSSDNPFHVVMRKSQIWKKCQDQIHQHDGADSIHGNGFAAGMNSCCPNHSSSEGSKRHRESVCDDDNEIDLDESDAGSSFNKHELDAKERSSALDIDENEICLDGDEEGVHQIEPILDKSPQHIIKVASDLKNGYSIAHDNEVYAASWGPSIPQLLVLGTGCASPSPLRGSSGYALFLPTMKRHDVESDESGSREFRPELSLTAVFECGEGFLTCLSRHLPPSSYVNRANRKVGVRNLNEELRQIRFIWISHAHLDHYGGLPCLIRAINKTKSRHCTCGREAGIANRKRKHGSGRMSSSCPCNLLPIIIAPSKVLQYLDTSLRCINGKIPVKKKDGDTGTAVEDHYRLFLGINHREFESSPFAAEIRAMIFDFTLLRQRHTNSSASYGECSGEELEKYRPFSLVRSIPVEHCPQAHALLLGLNWHQDTQRVGCGSPYTTIYADNSPAGINKGGTSPSFLLCFSGDTRPSPSLVRACRDVSFRYGEDQRVSLLLHESTFSDDERGVKEAREKRHSTVLEALGIARQIQAKACILTHFSQRYPHLPPSTEMETALESKRFRGHKTASLGMNGHPNYAFATDGLLLPLSPMVLPSLSAFNDRMVNVLMSMISSNDVATPSS